MNFSKKIIVALFAGIVFGLPAHAQTATTNNATSDPEDKSADPVFVFNSICYAKVHDFDAIKDMAQELAWRAIDNADLNEFRSYQNPNVLLGWDARVGDRLFRLGITQAPMSSDMKEKFPDFSNGSASSCSLILDDQQEAAKFMPNMRKLAGKEPISKDVKDGPLLTTTWAGGNEDIKVFLFAKVPPTGKGGLLNVTIFQKK